MVYIIHTLSFYNNEPSKNKHFLILLSSLARNSQEPKLKRIFEIPWVLFEKSASLHFDWPKSWIWRTLEKVMNIFCKWHFDNASKEVFWQKNFEFHARVQKCHFGNFSILPKWHFWTRAWNSKKKFAKITHFKALWKCHLKKIFITFSRVRQIQDLGQSKYKLRLFSKRTHGILKILLCRVPMNL